MSKRKYQTGKWEKLTHSKKRTERVQSVGTREQWSQAFKNVFKRRGMHQNSYNQFDVRPTGDEI